VTPPVSPSHPINSLPPKQRAVLEHLAAFLADRGYPPSIKQLCELCGVSSTATMHYHLTTLKKKEFIHWNDSERRAITLTDMAQSYFNQTDSMAEESILSSLPILGRIVAGEPLMPATDATETLDVLETFCHDDEAYLLRVSGESMIEDHIADGDLVLVRPKARVRNGDIVVALVQGMETTLKRLEQTGENVILHPANASMQPMTFPATDVTIQGKVEAVIRRYDR
jgi:repressor LexA